jgi:hypothetical protein
MSVGDAGSSAFAGVLGVISGIDDVVVEAGLDGLAAEVVTRQVGHFVGVDPSTFHKAKSSNSIPHSLQVIQRSLIANSVS